MTSIASRLQLIFCPQVRSGERHQNTSSTTKIPPEHDYFVMTRTKAESYSRLVTKGLQYANAFVIQFRSVAQAGESRLPGRVEHVASGRTATFKSIEELPQLLLKMLRGVVSDGENGIG